MAHLLLLKISDNKTGEYVIVKHITNNVNEGWPDNAWIRRHKRKSRLKREILHFGVDYTDLMIAEQFMRDRCADDPLNKTDFIPPIHRRSPRSEETKRKQSEKMKGRVYSAEHKANISAAMRKGYKDGTRPVNISYHNSDNKEKMNKKIMSNPYHKDRPKIKCPHCYKVVSINMYNRWHGDNCRSNW